MYSSTESSKDSKVFFSIRFCIFIYLIEFFKKEKSKIAFLYISKKFPIIIICNFEENENSNNGSNFSVIGTIPDSQYSTII